MTSCGDAKCHSARQSGSVLAVPLQLQLLTQGWQPRSLMLQDENGNKVTWAGEGTPNEDIWGPEGWCEAETPKIR